jgi:hypothetical protein
MSIEQNLINNRPLRRAGVRTRLAVCATMILLVTAGIASAQSVDFAGKTFVNKGLVGVARVPSNAVDEFGETLGGFGSGMAMDLRSWLKDRDGSYRGVLYMLPDRGWNTQGTTDFRGRLHRFDVILKPFYGASTPQQDQLSLRYRNSALFHQHTGVPTTGLDPSGVKPATSLFPDLPIGPNGMVT